MWDIKMIRDKKSILAYTIFRIDLILQTTRFYMPPFYYGEGRDSCNCNMRQVRNELFMALNQLPQAEVLEAILEAEAMFITNTTRLLKGLTPELLYLSK